MPPPPQYLSLSLSSVLLGRAEARKRGRGEADGGERSVVERVAARSRVLGGRATVCRRPRGLCLRGHGRRRFGRRDRLQDCACVVCLAVLLGSQPSIVRGANVNILFLNPVLYQRQFDVCLARPWRKHTHRAKRGGGLVTRPLRWLRLPLPASGVASPPFPRGTPPRPAASTPTPANTGEWCHK